MGNKWERVLSEAIGVFGVHINSALVSAQQRKRIYWTNIRVKQVGLFGELHSDIPQPKDEGILLRDILENDVDEKYYLSEKGTIGMISHKERHHNNGNGFGVQFINIDSEKSNTILSRYYKDCKDNAICVAQRGRNPDNPSDRTTGSPTKQRLEPNYSGKTNTITTVQKDNLIIQLNSSTESGGKQPYQYNRIYDANGISPCLDTDRRSPAILIVPEATSKGYTEINPGECFDFEQPNSKTRRGRKMDEKSNSLMSQNMSFMNYTENYRIRRLTPTECARLQTIPEWYKWSCSDTQQYRMLGNGWTVKVIMHILKHLK
jgi:site-specific DNA-cytosine methylase